MLAERTLTYLHEYGGAPRTAVLPARARALMASLRTRVLPVPGGPHTSRTPGLRYEVYASHCAGENPFTGRIVRGRGVNRPAASS
jgi:hypothetical protein